eukprot:3517210-Pyramimonas_sp.AAC.1
MADSVTGDTWQTHDGRPSRPAAATDGVTRAGSGGDLRSGRTLKGGGRTLEGALGGFLPAHTSPPSCPAKWSGAC